jgi:hypothetical protein
MCRPAKCEEVFRSTYLRRFVADLLHVVLAKVPLLLVVGQHEGLHGHQLRHCHERRRRVRPAATLVPSCGAPFGAQAIGHAVSTRVWGLPDLGGDRRDVLAHERKPGCDAHLPDRECFVWMSSLSLFSRQNRPRRLRETFLDRPTSGEMDAESPLAAALRDVEKLRREVCVCVRACVRACVRVYVCACVRAFVRQPPDGTGLPGAAQIQVAEADSVFQRAHENYLKYESIDGRQPSSRDPDAAMRSHGGAGLDTGKTSSKGVHWQEPPESSASYEARLESFQADTERVSCLLLLSIPRESLCWMERISKSVALRKRGWRARNGTQTDMNTHARQTRATTPHHNLCITRYCHRYRRC